MNNKIPTISPPTLSHPYLEIARKAALAAGIIQQEYYGKQIHIQTKSSGIDLVTEVDLACDVAIRDILATAKPQGNTPISMITEETFDEAAKSQSLEAAWVVDPLDGTTNFAHSFPHFAVSIAYLEHGQPTLGIIFDPIKHQLFTAVAGQGAQLEWTGFLADAYPKRVIQTSQAEQLSTALLATGFPYDIASNPRNNLDYLARMLKKCHGVRRPGAAALDLAYVACGRLDGFWEITLSPWDLAAGVLLVHEAGGACLNLDGQPLDYSQRRIDIVSASGSGLLQEMLGVLTHSAVATP